MWFIGVEVGQETSAPHLKKILGPPLRRHKLIKSQLLMMQYNLFFIPYLVIFGTRFSKVLLSLQKQNNFPAWYKDFREMGY